MENSLWKMSSLSNRNARPLDETWHPKPWQKNLMNTPPAE